MPSENNTQDLGSVNVNIEVNVDEPIPYAYCYNCDEPLTEVQAYGNTYDDEIRCEMCNIDYIDDCRYNDDEGVDEDLNFRDYDRKKYTSRKKQNLETNILQSDRGFGIELEYIGKNYSSINNIIYNLDPRIGVSADGSLSGDTGFELQLPLVNGKNGELLVEKTCNTINEYNAKVDDSCGYHIHLQAKSGEQKFEFIQRLMFFGLIFEDVLLSFLPKSRQRNRFAQRLRNYIDVDIISEATDKKDLDTIWYKSYNKRELSRRKRNKYDSVRYYGFNFHCYLGKSKHLEIRHHNGTSNAKKILEWANLNCLILDFIKKEVEMYPTLNEWPLKNILVSKYDKYFDSDNLINQDYLLEKTNTLFELIGLSQNSRDYFINRQQKLTLNNEKLCVE